MFNTSSPIPAIKFLSLLIGILRKTYVRSDDLILQAQPEPGENEVKEWDSAFIKIIFPVSI